MSQVLTWLEAERDVDPDGAIRQAVRRGHLRLDDVAEFVRAHLAVEGPLVCSAEQLTAYVLALLDDRLSASPNLK